MKKNLSKIRSKVRNAVGEPKRGLLWINPDTLTTEEQASLYRDFYKKNKERLEKQQKRVKEWRMKNREKTADYCKQYHEKNKERRSQYNKKLYQLRKNEE